MHAQVGALALAGRLQQAGALGLQLGPHLLSPSHHPLGALLPPLLLRRLAPILPLQVGSHNV